MDSKVLLEARRLFGERISALESHDYVKANELNAKARKLLRDNSIELTDYIHWNRNYKPGNPYVAQSTQDLVDTAVNTLKARQEKRND